MNKIPKNKDEVLRYLGYRNQNLDRVTDSLIEECMEEMRNLIREKYIYRFFDICRENGEVSLDETNLVLTGDDIKEHLEKSESCILMAVTLGNDVDSKIRYYERKSVTKALILDACATAAVEEICDEICEKLEKKVNEKNKTLTDRYSPGYGDLPIDIQNDFLSVLEAQKSIGLTANSHSILIPRKSVTAIVGVLDVEDKHGRKEVVQSFANGINNLLSSKNNTCLDCKKYSTCMFRREDGKCGGFKKA